MIEKLEFLILNKKQKPKDKNSKVSMNKGKKILKTYKINKQ